MDMNIDMIGYWHHTVVCPSVWDAVDCGAQGRCRGLKVVRRVSRKALPIDFFIRFCYRKYRSSTTHSEKPNRLNFRVWNSSVVT